MPDNELVTEDRYAQLRRSIAESDPYELSAALAALQLMPENANTLAILESAAEFAATLRGPRTKMLRRSDLSAVVRAFEMTCDPFEGLFTQSLTVPGIGPTTVFCGRDPAAPYVVSALMAAIFEGPAPMERAFTSEALTECRALLVLSDAVATRGGMKRGMRAIGSAPNKVVLPDQARLDKLRAAVRFPTEELRQLLGPRAVDLVLPIAHGQGGGLCTDLLSGPLHHNPLLAGEGELVVALPGSVLPALTELLLRRAGALRPQLAERFRAAVSESVEDSLEELGLHGPWHSDEGDARERVLTMTTKLDTDAALAVHIAVDVLDGFEAGGLDGEWEDAHAVVAEMERRAVRIEKDLSSAPPDLAPNAILHLFVIQGVGRPFTMGLGDPEPPLESPRLLLSAEELSVICVLEAREPLALLKFARAMTELHERTRVVAFGTLAPYQLYRQHERSFYLGDEPPTLVAIDDGLAEEARVAAYNKRDLHAAALPGRREYAVVQLLDGDVRVPLYRESRPRRGRVQLLAELDVDCWLSVTIPEHDAAVSMALSYASLGVYWLWQLEPSAGGMFTAAASDGTQLCIQLELEVGPEFDGPTGAPPGIIATLADPHAVLLRVPSSFANALAGRDNAGERVFVRALLVAIRTAAAAHGHVVPSDTTLDAWVQARAPLGLKKRALHVSVARNFELIDQGLPATRPLQDPDYADVLDELGAELRRRGHRIGPIASNGRLDVLRETVDWAFTELEREIATVAPDGLLEWLVGRHEALLGRQAHMRLETPTELACYPMLDDLPGRLDEERLRLVHTAMALRVVIEAVVAAPPRGLRRMSLALHDRLLALALEGINRAYARDAIQNSLLDEPMSILRSGRLGMRHEGPFYTGQTAYLSVAAHVEVEQATRAFPRHWETTTEADPWEDSAVDHAAKLEFGFTLMQLTALCFEIAKYGLEEIDGEVKQIRRADLVATLTERLRWQAKDLDAALEVFVLRPRDGLRHAPSGFDAADAYPWRMNRRLSYLRRPLIEMPAEEGPWLVWGTRHLKDGNQYLIQLCQEGRLRSRTREMQKAIAQVRDVQTHAFNTTVADRIRGHGLVVRKNVKKIGKLRIARQEGAELGDVDVLAADAQRRVVLAVETKDLGLARTPLEMGQQIRNIFVGGDGHRCDIDKHLDRAQWLREHLKEVLSFLDIDEDPSDWTVQALVVTDEPLMSPYVVSTKIPVLALRDLADGQRLFPE